MCFHLQTNFACGHSTAGFDYCINAQSVSSIREAASYPIQEPDPANSKHPCLDCTAKEMGLIRANDPSAQSPTADFEKLCVGLKNFDLDEEPKPEPRSDRAARRQHQHQPKREPEPGPCKPEPRFKGTSHVRNALVRIRPAQCVPAKAGFDGLGVGGKKERLLFVKPDIPNVPRYLRSKERPGTTKESPAGHWTANEIMRKADNALAKRGPAPAPAKVGKKKGKA
jgi:hypothetical protein